MASLSKFIRYIREELLIVIATTSSETVLPRMIAKLKAAGCEESVVGLVIPTGYSFNLDGTCLYLATAAVFLAQATNTPLPVGHQIELLAVLLLASKGASPARPSSGSQRRWRRSERSRSEAWRSSSACIV